MALVPFNPEHWRKPLLAALLDSCRKYGASRAVAADITAGDMTCRQLFARAFILTGKLKKLLGQDQYVGMLLPNANAAMVTFFALHMLHRVPSMLNFSAGSASVLHACRIARVSTVLTSRTFIEKAKLEDLAQALEKEVTLIYLEDVRASVGLGDKLSGVWKALTARSALADVISHMRADDPAVVLYTSGSEGVPKGVVLSHANILANIGQIVARLDLAPGNIVFNAMPVFHSFGLTIGMLMPPICGIKSFLYPSPVHYRIIPEVVEKSGATIMLGTDTFYNGYARYAEAKHFKKVWLAVAGAEKLKEPTRLHWQEKLGVNILQGYGVTETSPVISVNTPAEHKPGTVGRMFPAMHYRIEPVEGLTEGGRLFVSGPNVMLGYLKADQPGVIQPQGEWYDTGDIVTVDGEGYFAICGRAKRFAKIAGEMVSLLMVEELAAPLLPEAACAAVAVNDEKRGEQVVLYVDAELTRDKLLQHAKAKGVAEIYIPRQIIRLEEIPRLGNGKIDYVTLQSKPVP